MIDKSLLLMYCYLAAQGNVDHPDASNQCLDRLTPMAKEFAKIATDSSWIFDRESFDQDVLLGLIEQVSDKLYGQEDDAIRFEAMLRFAVAILVPSSGCLNGSRHLKFLEAFRDAINLRISWAVDASPEIKARRSAYFCS